MSQQHRNHRKRSISSPSEEDESTLWNPSRTDQNSPGSARRSNSTSHHRGYEPSTLRQRIDQELSQLRSRSHFLHDPERGDPQPPKRPRMMSPPRDSPCAGGHNRRAGDGKWQHDMWQWQDNSGGNNSAQPNNWGNNQRPMQNPNGNNSSQPNDWGNNQRPMQNPNGNNSSQTNDWGNNQRPMQNPNGNNSSQPNDWGNNQRPMQNPNGNNSSQPNDWGNNQRPMQNPNGNNSSQPNDWGNNAQERKHSNENYSAQPGNRGTNARLMQNPSGNNSSQPNNWGSNSQRPTQYPNKSNLALSDDRDSNSQENKGCAGQEYSFPLPSFRPSSQATETRPASPVKYKIPANVPGLLPGAKMLVKPSVVSGLDSIYLWNYQWDQQLLRLQSQVTSACQPGGKAGVAGKLDVGDACLAKHLTLWFRATVIKKPVNGMVNVLLVDYGNQINVDLQSSVKAITEQLAKPHAFAIHCSLRGATPIMGSFWSPSETVLFINTVSNKVIQALFVSLETTKGIKYSVVLLDGVVCINQIFGAKPHALLPSTTLPCQPPPAGNVFISYFLNPGSFSIHLTCQQYTMSHIERQIEEIDKTLKLRTADRGELVLAPRNNAYHRARVVEVKDGRAKCRFFDLGVTNLMKVMKISELLPMPDSLKQVAPLRYDVKLAGVEPARGVQWAEKCPKTDQIFLSYPDFELITAVKHSDEELWQVELKQPGTTSTLSELLIKSQVANKALTGSFAAGGLLKVNVSYFQTSPTLIHLQEKNRLKDLEALQAKLKSLDLSSANPHIPVFGNVVLAAARSPEDGEWYRVLPLFMMEDKVSVYFVDYGNQDIVSEMRELPGNLAKLPYFSVPCRLPVKPIDSDTFSPETLAKLEDMLFKEGQTILARVHCRDDAAILVADILIGQQSLSEMLISEKVATSIIVSGYVSSVVSQHSFFIQPSENENKIRQMEDRLAKEEFEEHGKVRKNHICIARFEDDKAWYRAIVVNVSGKKVVVYFYDYGNTATVTELRKMPDDLKNIPALAKHCTLHLIPSSQVEIDKFTNAALDGTVLYKFVYMTEVNRAMEVVMLKNDTDLISSNFALKYPVKVRGQLFLPPVAPCQSSTSPVVCVEPCHTLLTSLSMASVKPHEIIVIDLSPQPSPAVCETVDVADECPVQTHEENLSNTVTVETCGDNSEIVGMEEENADSAETHVENSETIETCEENAEIVENREENAEIVNNPEENLNTSHDNIQIQKVSVEIETDNLFKQLEEMHRDEDHSE